jgi:hypothetical protein
MIASYGLSSPSATTAIDSQYQAAGLDGGNGFIKFATSNTEVMIPSLIKQVSDGNDYDNYTASSKGGLIEFVETDRTELNGTRWLIGQPAYREFPDSHDRITDSRENKVLYGLQALCGCLTTAPHNKNWNLALASSIHDAQVYGNKLKEALNGSHTVRVNGHLTTVSVRTLALDEGVGAIYHAINRGIVTKDSQTVLLDIGFGTTIIAVYNGASILRASRYVHPQGTGKLIQMIADHPETRSFCGGVSGDPLLIRQGIETDFSYGRTTWNFKDIYQAVLMDWVKEVLSPCLKKVDTWLPSSDALLASGGGALMPAMTSVLAKKKIGILENSQMTNVLGMQAIAQMKLQQ